MKLGYLGIGAVLAGAALSCVAGSTGSLGASQDQASNIKLFHGKLKYGQTDSAVGDLSFVTKSNQGDKILRACKMDDFCKVRASVKPRAYSWIDRLVSVDKVPVFSQPCDPLKYIYSQLSDAYNFTLDDDDLDQVFTQKLSQLIMAAKTRQKTETLIVITTPWFVDQDGWPRNAKMTATPLDDGEAICRVTFSNAVDAGDKIEKYNFEMSKTSAGWRINNARIPLSAPGKLDSYADTLSPIKK